MAQPRLTRCPFSQHSWLRIASLPSSTRRLSAVGPTWSTRSSSDAPILVLVSEQRSTSGQRATASPLPTDPIPKRAGPSCLRHRSRPPYSGASAPRHVAVAVRARPDQAASSLSARPMCGSAHPCVHPPPHDLWPALSDHITCCAAPSCDMLPSTNTLQAETQPRQHGWMLRQWWDGGVPRFCDRGIIVPHPARWCGVAAPTCDAGGVWRDCRGSTSCLGYDVMLDDELQRATLPACRGAPCA
jgi:hypothetical protein